jgi:toxin YoeB
MAKQIVWTKRAESDRLKILKYWINRNKSKTYSKKLNNLFNMAVEMVASHPENEVFFSTKLS